ncbi:malate synthase A [Yoonia sp. BS5-3]|uniref:Malate synthase n=1 Tax=Yoonia phaeophyticola TaxID=3137369 RepID=A0ABZ2V793_9RHOB
MPLDLSQSTKAQPMVLRDVTGADRVLTAEALAFLCDMHDAFSQQLQERLTARSTRQKAFDAGQLPGYLSETKDIRDGVWTAAPAPANLQDRRVEITGPVDRKMMINALNSGAKAFMADFEDASAPRFAAMIAGQVNLQDFRDETLTYDDPTTGTHYATSDDPAVLIVRPRGFHLEEANVLIGGRSASAALFDFALHMFHNGKALHDTGRGPYFYLPKLENHQEARLWAAILAWTEDKLDLPSGCIKVTALIETLPAAFEMDEIIWELRQNIVGLNCGRWDYIFSYLKTMRAHPFAMLPDRDVVTMDTAFLASYAARLIKVCHRRGIHAMGGMAAQIPIKDDPDAMAVALDRVRADKLREVEIGHDGTWVAHPALVSVAMSVFDQHMPQSNQIKAPRQYYAIEETKLLAPHNGKITLQGVQSNLHIAVEYLSHWLCGRGAVPINGLMEDAATAEICRMQLWQWLHHSAQIEIEEGRTRVLDPTWFSELVQAEVARILAVDGPAGFHRGHYASAIRIVSDAVMADTPPDFITLPAYDVLNVLD